jgi:hypothetical protein
LTTPSTTTPGKPIEMRSKGGCIASILISVSSTAAGTAGCGVSQRTRSVSGLPMASSNNILIPVPPISTLSVVCGAFADAGSFAFILTRRCTWSSRRP